MAYLVGVVIGVVIQVGAWWRLGRLIGCDRDPRTWKRWRLLVVVYLWWGAMMWFIGADDTEHPTVVILVAMGLPLMVGSWVLGVWEVGSWLFGRNKSGEPDQMENDPGAGATGGDTQT